MCFLVPIAAAGALAVATGGAGARPRGLLRLLATLIAWHLITTNAGETLNGTMSEDGSRSPGAARRRRKLPWTRPDAARRPEVVEGCFNRFDALAEVPIGTTPLPGLFNNARCQSACADMGYALAATRSSPVTCLCGNDYPSPFHQMDSSKCDSPCSPDQYSCYLFSCCGSRDGQLFTVSFSRQQNILLHVLRQLSFDYRFTSPSFRSKIEASFADASPFEMLPADGGEGNGDGGPRFLAARTGASACDGADGSWTAFQGACYRLQWATPVGQQEAQEWCAEHAKGAALVIPSSPAENEFVAQLQGGCTGWLGLHGQPQGQGGSTMTRRSPGGLESTPQQSGYRNWTQAASRTAAAGSTACPCALLRPDGAWLCAPCGPRGRPGHVRSHWARHQASCFVCKRPETVDSASPVVSLSTSPTDSWRLIETGAEGCSGPLTVRVQHEASQQLLACSPETGRLGLAGPDASDARTIFSVQVDEDEDGRGAFALHQQSLVVAIVDDELVCRPSEDDRGRSWIGATVAARFVPACILRVLARRFLRLSIVALSNDLHYRGQRECSVAAYDPTPATDSFRCRPLPQGPAYGATGGVDELWLEQQALLISDHSRWLAPRAPLPFGRLRCANEHPQQSAICTIAYGRGVTMARAFTVDWNLLLFDTITTRINAAASLSVNFPVPGGGGGGGGDGDSGNQFTFSVAATKELVNDFTVLFNTIYEVAVVHAYVETRNWQTSLLARPLTTTTLQFWLEVVTVTYRWRALFQARGSFRVKYFGRAIGGQHAVGDLSTYDDVFFYVFGRYDYPVETSIIITINDAPEERWPLSLPTTSVVDEPFFNR